MTGFARYIRAENPGLNFVTLSLDIIISPETASATVLRIWSHITSNGNGNGQEPDENNFFEKNGAIYIPRIAEARATNELIAAKIGGEPAVENTWAVAGDIF